MLCGIVAFMSGNGLEPVQKAAAPANDCQLPIQVLWLALAAMGSVMLLAVTNHITQNIASVPFLWVLPLALYLVTFILAFDHPRWYVRPLFVSCAGGAAAARWPGTCRRSSCTSPCRSTWSACSSRCMVCHGELARRSRIRAHLTRFLPDAVGRRRAGAVLVAIVAPLTLSGYFELGIALVVLAALRGPARCKAGRWAARR